MTTDFERGVREGMRRAAAMFLVRQEDVDAWCEVRIPPASSGAEGEPVGPDPNCPDCLGRGGNVVSFDPPMAYPCGCTFPAPATPEPRGCPTPGACSCPAPATAVADAERAVLDAAWIRWTDARVPSGEADAALDAASERWEAALSRPADGATS